MTDDMLDVSELAEKLASGETTSAELTEDCIRRILASPLRAQFAYLDADVAMEAARASDLRRSRGCALGALDGIPFAAEDRFCTVGMPTENRCGFLRGWHAPYEAEAVRRLRTSGAVLLGKLRTNGFSSVNSEPVSGEIRFADWNIPFALIAETGGGSWLWGDSPSVVICPARDRISREGLISCAPSFDRVGFLVRSLADGEYLLNVLAEPTPRVADPDPVKLAWWNGNRAVGQPVPFEVGDTVELPVTERTKLAYRVLSAVEAASEMGLYDGIRFGSRASAEGTARERTAKIRGANFSREEQKLLLLGTALLMGEFREDCYFSALRLRRELLRSMDAFFSQYRALACPASVETGYLAGFADLSALSLNGVLWMAPRGREAALLHCAKGGRDGTGGV